MKHLIFCSILFCAIAAPALGELTDTDLDKIRLIVKEEIAPVKADVETLKVDVARLEGRLTGLEGRLTGLEGRLTGIEKQISHVTGLEGRLTGLEGRLTGIEKQISHATNVTYGLIALIVVAIGLPAWRGKRDREQERKMEELIQEIETLKENYGNRS